MKNALSLLAALLLAPSPARSEITVATADTYAGWPVVSVTNSLIGLKILPRIGGRIIQFSLGSKEFLWVNRQLAGKWPVEGLAQDKGWFNVGGDKLWPAPQGWDGDSQWPGPPDAVLDGQPYRLERIPGGAGAAFRLTSGNDPLSGIRFSRVIRIFPDSTRVSFEATMTNTDTRLRRWGIWAHTQLDGGGVGGGYNPLMQAWCPINPRSSFAKGYSVIFGKRDNPSFRADRKRGLVHVTYRYQVGKIGVDSPGGWVASVDGTTGAVFVQRFVFEPGREYPDGSSVEFWLNGVGKIHAYGKDIPMGRGEKKNPYVFESEILSPMKALLPGRSHTWRYDWYAANIGGNHPVTECTEAGVVAGDFTAHREGGRLRLRGRFGVFAPGSLHALFLDGRGRRIGSCTVATDVSPLREILLDTEVTPLRGTSRVRLELMTARGKSVGALAEACVPGQDNSVTPR